ncbi:hypothetical protein FVE85_4990 [Porphyridium purpureum]|uniref:AMP-activated protein kinase glycogen-binding domain-containing protein n=1 Tax=Porphyridium purpureum TaxID=35688 RepID=A0A5J4YSP7_PORPP|nr:hypothetical protein FVE85_4990 [Porphyridium purpureum]|eukprot:POR0108..scf236_6
MSSGSSARLASGVVVETAPLASASSSSAAVLQKKALGKSASSLDMQSGGASTPRAHSHVAPAHSGYSSGASTPRTPGSARSGALRRVGSTASLRNEPKSPRVSTPNNNQVMSEFVFVPSKSAPIRNADGSVDAAKPASPAAGMPVSPHNYSSSDLGALRASGVTSLRNSSSMIDALSVTLTRNTSGLRESPSTSSARLASSRDAANAVGKGQASASSANEVYLLGDWNNWMPVSMNQESAGHWCVITPVPTGYHEYCFEVDGRKMVSTRHPLCNDGHCNWRTIYGPRHRRKSWVRKFVLMIRELFLAASSAPHTPGGVGGGASGANDHEDEISEFLEELSEAGTPRSAAGLPKKPRAIYPLRYFIFAMLVYLVVYYVITTLWL